MSNKPRKPHADTALAAFLQKRIAELKSRKSQADIASQAGFVNVNVLSMIKSGATKLPLDRVPALAEALECDARRLFALALQQVEPSTALTAIESIFKTIVTANESAWLEELRRASDNSDPVMTTRARSAIRAIFGK